MGNHGRGLSRNKHDLREPLKYHSGCSVSGSDEARGHSGREASQGSGPVCGVMGQVGMRRAWVGHRGLSLLITRDVMWERENTARV